MREANANEQCFYGLFSIPPEHRKLVVDSVVWAFKHTERNLSETGLDILHELLANVGKSAEVSQPFYQQFLLQLIQDVFGIMTDRLHKSGLGKQVLIPPLRRTANLPDCQTDCLTDYLTDLLTVRRAVLAHSSTTRV